MKKNMGVTFIELSIIIVLLGIIGMMGLKFFRNTFRTWWSTRDIVQVQSDSRIALDEMSTFIRQASTSPITISGSGESIKFTIDKSTYQWHPDRRVKYFKAGNTLQRFMKGSTTTLIGEGVTIFQVVHSTGSRYESVDIDLELTKEEEQADLSRSIVLRSRQGE